MMIEQRHLVGDRVTLEPLRTEHIPALCEAGLHAKLWQWTVSEVANEASMTAYVHSALEDQNAGIALPFATRDRVSGKIVGSTRFGNIDAANRKTEIGWTWVTPVQQRTYVNTEAKLLMLTHAFETWNCVRVEFKTDALNSRSRAAIVRIGAREEGILRNHMITESGRFRDSVYFSIIESEWELVKEKLMTMLR